MAQLDVPAKITPGEEAAKKVLARWSKGDSRSAVAKAGFDLGLLVSGNALSDRRAITLLDLHRGIKCDGNFANAARDGLEAGKREVISREEALAECVGKEAANDNTPTVPFKLEMYGDIEPNIKKNWLVRDILGCGEFSVWYGRPGAGKSAIVGDLACHVAAGWDWFGHKVTGGPVLYIAAERAQVVKRRFAAFRKERSGLADDLPLGVVSGHIDFCSNANHAAAMVKQLVEFEASVGATAELIVIDTISRTLAGGDENNPKEMGSFVAKVGMIQAYTDAHILAIHHPPNEGTPRLRGHGLLLGALDTTVLVRKNSKDRTAIVEKQNDGEEGVKLNFDLRSVTLFEDDDGITTAPVVVPIGGNLAGMVQEVPLKRGPTGKALKVFSSLRSAIEASGEKPPEGSPGFPDAITVVTRETWRSQYYLDVDASGDKDTMRKAFDRALLALVAAEHVTNVGEWYWPA